jgi:hypothetical protein
MDGEKGVHQCNRQGNRKQYQESAIAKPRWYEIILEQHPTYDTDTKCDVLMLLKNSRQNHRWKYSYKDLKNAGQLTCLRPGTLLLHGDPPKSGHFARVIQTLSTAAGSGTPESAMQDWKAPS